MIMTTTSMSHMTIRPAEIDSATTLVDRLFDPYRGD